MAARRRQGYVLCLLLRSALSCASWSGARDFLTSCDVGSPPSPPAMPKGSSGSLPSHERRFPSQVALLDDLHSSAINFLGAGDIQLVPIFAATARAVADGLACPLRPALLEVGCHSALGTGPFSLSRGCFAGSVSCCRRALERWGDKTCWPNLRLRWLS